jgi:hypothetical protein
VLHEALCGVNAAGRVSVTRRPPSTEDGKDRLSFFFLFDVTSFMGSVDNAGIAIRALSGENMSVAEIKAMGERLANHLASKHGVKLKHTAILETIAVQFGFKDWNTFRATLNEEPASSTTSQAGNVVSKASGSRYLLGYNADERYELTHEELRRNLLICGAPGSGISTVTQTLWSQHVAAGGGLIYLNTGRDNSAEEGLRKAFIKAGRPEEFHVLDFTGRGASASFNPLTDERASAEEVARIALARHRGLSSDADFWNEASQQFIKAMVVALRAARRPVTFQTLWRLVQEREARTELIASLEFNSKAASELQAIHSRIQESDRTASSILGLIAAALAPFTQREVTDIFEGSHNPLCVRDLIRKQHGLYINLPVYSKDSVQLTIVKLVIMHVMLATSDIAQRFAGSDECPPFLIFLGDVGAYWTPDVDALFATGPAANVSLVVTQQTLSQEVLGCRCAQTLMGQTWCKLFLRQETLEGAKLASEVVGSDYRVRSDGLSALRASEHHFRRLNTGEGWCIKGPDATTIQVARLP